MAKILSLLSSPPDKRTKDLEKFEMAEIPRPTAAPSNPNKLTVAGPERQRFVYGLSWDIMYLRLRRKLVQWIMVPTFPINDQSTQNLPTMMHKDLLVFTELLSSAKTMMFLMGQIFKDGLQTTRLTPTKELHPIEVSPFILQNDFTLIPRGSPLAARREDRIGHQSDGLSLQWGLHLTEYGRTSRRGKRKSSSWIFLDNAAAVRALKPFPPFARPQTPLSKP
ncbi:hypothetical protein FB451DRAFT_1187606 [Mycena latifolia]|nr:hypothetical protein FB451DRAFT_1187606 [Mycena latifolia]